MNHRNSCLSTEPLVALLSVHRVLGAICDRIHVFRRAADRIAGREHQGGADQHDRRYLLEHLVLSSSEWSNKRCAAGTAPLRGWLQSDGDGRRDVRMGIVIFEDEILRF